MDALDNIAAVKGQVERRFNVKLVDKWCVVFAKIASSVARAAKIQHALLPRALWCCNCRS
jgi:hypothetical protein